MVPDSNMASTMRQLPPEVSKDCGGMAKAGLGANACSEEDVLEVMVASSIKPFHASIQLDSTYYYL